MIERLKSKYGENAPIFIDDIRAELIEYSRPRVFQLIDEAVKKQELVRFDTGVYYIPTKTIFGLSKLNPRLVIEKRFLKNENSNYGFYGGITLMNSVGITEQVPNIIEIVTNNETNRVRDIVVGNQVVRARKSRTTITKENYKALQILELFNNIKIQECADKMDNISNFVKKSGVSSEEIFKYSAYYPAKAIKNYILCGV